VIVLGNAAFFSSAVPSGFWLMALVRGKPHLLTLPAALRRKLFSQNPGKKLTASLGPLVAFKALNIL